MKNTNYVVSYKNINKPDPDRTDVNFMLWEQKLRIFFNYLSYFICGKIIFAYPIPTLFNALFVYMMSRVKEVETTGEDP